jgi:hypothetical protein
MPDAIPVSVCKAIATSLTGGSFSQTISVDRKYVPAHSVKDLQSVYKVTVVNNGYRRNVNTRRKVYVESTIAARVYVESAVAANDVAAVEALVYLTEEIREHLELNAFDGAHFAPEEETPDVVDIFDPEALQENGIYRAIIDLTLRKA